MSKYTEISDNKVKINIGKKDIDKYLINVWRLLRRIPSVKYIILEGQGTNNVEKAISLACYLSESQKEITLHDVNLNVKKEDVSIGITFVKLLYRYGDK